MALSGTLETLGLAEIFQTLERSQASGVLRLVSLSESREVVFKSGIIINILITDGPKQVTLADRVDAAGVITDGETLTRLKAGTGGYSTIKTLEESGSDLKLISTTLQEQLQDEIFDLFTWEEANFEFLEANGDIQASYAVEQSEALNITINTSATLMEAARQLDEWNRIQVDLPEPGTVFQAVPGRETALQELASEYPARAIVPYIDGVHSLEEIVNNSVASRLLVYNHLIDYVNQGLITKLSSQQILQNAKVFEEQGFYDQAACLYRRALATNPGDHKVREALARVLTQQGEGYDAAACYGELARAYLSEGDTAQACQAAEQALQLNHTHEQINIYIQCLESAGRIDDATEQMRQLAAYHVAHRQWQEAKHTSAQVLTINPEDDYAQDVLALAFSHSCDVELGEHEIACMHCLQVNDRNNVKCDNCGNALHKLCRNCHSETACSDSVCLFCGKNPHIADHLEQSSGLYEQINEQDSELRALIKRATKLRDEGEFEKSLAVWKDISLKASNNKSVHSQIRELEAAVHNQRIEMLITRGNHYRRNRGFARAIKCYTEAHRILAPRDPRRDRLEQILKTCKRDNKRTQMVYALACVALLVTGLLVAEPYIQYHFYKQAVAEAEQEVSTLIAAGGGIAAYQRVSEITAPLRARGRQLGGRAKKNILPIVLGQEQQAHAAMSAQGLVEIESALEAGQPKAALQKIAEFKTSFGGTEAELAIDALSKQAQAMIEEQQVREQLLKDSPRLLAAGRDLMENKRYAEALRRFQTLVESPDRATSEAAREYVKRLQAEQSTFESAMQRSDALLTSDLNQARDLHETISEQARRWDATKQWQAIRDEIAKRIEQSERAFERLADSTNQGLLEEFINNYPGSDAADKARDRLNDLRNEQEAIARELADIQAYREASDWERLHLAGRRFIRSFGSAVAERFKMPLVIDSVPAGATVLIDGQAVGTTPYVLHYDWKSDHDIRLQLAGYQQEQRTLFAIREHWQLTINFNKEIQQTYRLGHYVYRMNALPEGLLVLGKGRLSILDKRGRVQGSLNIGSMGMLEDNLDRWARMLAFNDSYIAVPQSTDTVAVLSHDGALVKSHQLSTDIESAPLLYVNELYGADYRLALADAGLVTGPVDGELKRIQDQDQVLSGPIVVHDDFDQLLVFVSHTGQFIGVEESGPAIRWEHPSGAAHVSPLQPFGEPGSYVCTLDDSRLALFDISVAGIKRKWDKLLPSSTIFDPIVSDRQIYVACREEVLVFDSRGNQRQRIEVSDGVRSVSARSGTGIVVGTAKGQVLFYDNEAKLQWKLQLKEDPSALLLIENRVYIGTNKGHVFILAP